jgi:hypothetical protein
MFLLQIHLYSKSNLLHLFNKFYCPLLINSQFYLHNLLPKYYFILSKNPPMFNLLHWFHLILTFHSISSKNIHTIIKIPRIMSNLFLMFKLILLSLQFY